MKRNLITIILIISISAIMYSCGENSSDNQDSGKADVVDGNKNAISQDIEGLQGKELAEAVLMNVKEPKNIYFKQKTKGEAYAGGEIITEFYKSGDNTRAETDKYVYICNTDEGVTYYWLKETKKGQKSQIVEEDEMTDNQIIDDNLDDLDDKNFESARLDTLDGKKVLYTENEEDGMKMKAWYSLEYGLILKHEVSDQSGNILTEGKIIEINAKKNFKNKMKPPKDIVFE